MTSQASRFRSRLRAAGLSESAISAAWPEWWSDAIDASASAQAELRFSVARKLGLDPTSLLDDDETPRFIWDDSAKYKNFSGDAARERPAITSFGVSVARLLVRATPAAQEMGGLEASRLRAAILANQPFIRLLDLLALVWGLGIPTIHLRVYPLRAKRMCAMAMRVGSRAAILLARDAQYPPWAIFHIAHEIGHIALGHVPADSGLVDMEDLSEQTTPKDDEEVAADTFALELLTGAPDFTVQKRGQGRSARELAVQCSERGPSVAVEPGTLALCYGHATGEWATVQAALPHIYDAPRPVHAAINQVAASHIAWDELAEDDANFLRAVMGVS